MGAALLPRFSDPADIQEFVDKLEAFERGALSSDEFRAFRLVRGVYGQRQEGAQMLRVKIPFGRLDRRGLDALADVADRFSRGFGHVTTRQNVQFHFLQMAEVESAMHRLDEAGLTTREACGNSVRSITAHEHSEVCPTAAFDVTPYAEALTRHFLRHELAASLPRKFKIALSCCADDCAKAAIHDLGLVAEIRDGARGFRVLAAGGLSSSPASALVLEEWVHAAELGRVSEAVLRMFHRLGNRENRQRARLKYVRKKLGVDGFVAAYREVKREVDAEAALELALPTHAAGAPGAPVSGGSAEPRPAGYLAWRASNVLSHADPEHTSVYVRLDLGDATSDQLRAIGRVAETYGDGTARLTIDQNVLVPWIHRTALPAVYRELSAHGLTRPDIHTARDVTSCQGADTCALAVTSSRSLARAITERLEAESIERLDAIRDTVIKVSGCPNSCGQHHIADLGFHGGAKHVGADTVPVYQLHLGGGVDASGATFGRQAVKIIARRVPDAVVRLFELYQSERADGERPRAFFARLDAKRAVAALGEIVTAAPRADEGADIGETSGFLVQTGTGECAA
ncbi:MAG: nitrite/sulfite reductase [Myxococcales bacterium]|nr:nitrite/sulfite reductase [Myxococcales bacterium]